MALPARLVAALGRHPDDLTEDDLQGAVDSQVPEGVDLDWKKDFYAGTDAGRKELAKDISAMANTVGGLLVVGVDDGKKDHAHALAPVEPVEGRGEEWIRSVLANWIQPVVPNVGVRRLESSEREGSIYWLITVPLSPQAPHAVAAPGNDYHFRVHVRNGTTTRTLAESEIAQRYRDRFHAISEDIDRLRQVANAGFGYLNSYLATEVPVGGIRASYIPLWITLAAVPAARGNRPLTTQRERQAAFERFHRLAGAGATADMQPEYPVLVGRRQLRFEGDPTGQLHQDGSFYGALPLHVSNDRREPDSPQLLYQRALEINLLVQVQAATAWAIETGASGDIMFSAMLHRFDGNDQPLRLAVSDDVFQRGPVGVLPAAPAQTTADLSAIAADKREAAITAYALVSDLLADMGAHEPHLLTPEGDLQLANLNSDWRAKLTGWE